MINRFTFCVGAFFALATPAMAKSAEEITARWQKQFEQLKSLSYNAEQIADFDGEIEPYVYKLEFVKDEEKYRSEVYFPIVNLPEGKGSISYTAASYDGEYYHTITKGVGTKGQKYADLNRSKKSRENFAPYGFPTPFHLQFAFAFEIEDLLSIDTFQNPKTWDKVLENIRSVEPATKDGRIGSMLLIDGAKAEQSFYKVFVDDLTGVPLHWLKFNKEKTDKVEGQLVISDFKQVGEKDTLFTFPTKMEATLLQGNKVVEQTLFIVDQETLKINEPVPQVFSFEAKPGMRFVDVDELEARIKEREKQKAAKK